MDELLQPIVQYGFAGMCAILLGILFWTIRKLLEVLKNNAEVIVLNTKAIETLNMNLTESKGEIRELKEEMYRRPCITGK